MEKCELTKFINTARKNCITIDQEICLSVEHLSNKIKDWGGVIKNQIQIKEFMSSKKCYEV